jgi:hypothetical protein
LECSLLHISKYASSRPPAPFVGLSKFGKYLCVRSRWHLTENVKVSGTRFAQESTVFNCGIL